jgi:hypothetical protein
MRKVLAFAVQVPFIAMVWSACGGGDNSNMDASPDVTAQDVKPDKKVMESGPLPDTGGMACTSVPVDGGVTWVPPHAPNPSGCSDLQIQSYYAACLTPPFTACSAWQTANPTCLKCIFSTYGTDTTYGALIYNGLGYVFWNFGGCIAIETGDMSATGCGAKAEALDTCEILSCSNCAKADPNYNACTTAAQGGTCASYANAECSSADAGYAAACGMTATTSQGIVTALATVFCGGYPADAGPPGDGGSGDSGSTDSGSTDAGVADAPTDGG